MLQRRVLIIDDEVNILSSLKGVLEDEHFIVETAKDGLTGLAKAKKFSPDVVLLDIWMPGDDGIVILEKLKRTEPAVQVIMMSGHGTVETAVKTIKMGAFDFLEKPIHFEKLLLLLEHAFDLKQLQDENRFLKEELHAADVLIGSSAPMQRLQRLISVTAPSSGWVLIRGENGTGKELVARALHDLSLRKRKKFVAVNCAAIPDELVESELFGHEKGSFTGAHERKVGKFEQADEGTLFLDEVGDMSPKMQAKILRVLQEGVIQRVGGQDTIEVDIRVIAATNKDLKKAIRNNEFREDLYYRLNVIPIVVPPLRDRKEDIPKLVEHFIEVFSKGKRLRLNRNTIALLQGYPWPGNVRELKNWVERACILSSDEAGTLEIPEHAEGDSQSADVLSFEETSLRAARAEFERQFIVRVLSENNWNVSRTAQLIGVERSHLHRKMKGYGIDISQN